GLWSTIKQKGKEAAIAAAKAAGQAALNAASEAL
uniref:Dermaseptin-H9 n=1 Tax=Pithecopus hypochondrialis TaxID=317381 RepID=DRS9_PITHY|nr:RecName: Full=Dermaseptin-H9; Short=DRS-H9; AltName: Full=DShypo 07 [Pithecopus hypochondrialis]